MDTNLNVINLYQNSGADRISSFKKRVKSDMLVDLHYDRVEANFEWLDLMEDTVQYLDNILRNPNRFIVNEEDVVKIELARRVTVDSIKHLAKNTNLIQDIDKKTGDVKPAKILNINKQLKILSL